MSLSLSVCSQSGLPICTSFWAFFRAFKALRALKGPPIKFSHILMHRPYRDLQNLKFSCLYLFPFSHKVVYQKASGRGGRGGRVVYHTSTGQYIGVATFFFFFLFEPGVKLDEKSIENGFEGQKFLVVCLFWGGCHHPNLEIINHENKKFTQLFSIYHLIYRTSQNWWLFLRNKS